MIAKPFGASNADMVLRIAARRTARAVWVALQFGSKRGSVTGSVNKRAMLPRDIESRFMIPILIIEPSKGMFIFVRGTSVGAYIKRISY